MFMMESWFDKVAGLTILYFFLLVSWQEGQVLTLARKQHVNILFKMV